MATKIRLRRTGTTNDAHFRIVATDSRFPRDGRFIEVLGHYNPRLKSDEKLVVNADRVAHWIAKGAQISEAVRSLLKLKGVKLPAPATRRPRRGKATTAAPAAAPAQA